MVFGYLQASAHDRVLDNFELKLREYGIPSEELGFRPQRAAQLLIATAGGSHTTSARMGGMVPSSFVEPQAQGYRHHDSSSGASGDVTRSESRVQSAKQVNFGSA
jgi:hypothetical protein